MAREAVLVLKCLMHADHFRILAVADGAGSCSGSGCAEKDDHSRANEESVFHDLIITPGERTYLVWIIGCLRSRLCADRRRSSFA
jgi:hypothetical protein